MTGNRDNGALAGVKKLVGERKAGVNDVVICAGTYISLFAGYTGLDLALRIACTGSQCKLYVENDAKAAEFLVAKIKSGCVDDAPIYGDIRSFNGKEFVEDVGGVDGIIGGFPCTNLSVAGDRDGIIEGNASGLWHEFARVISEVRPQWVFVENVAGILVPHEHDTDPGRVLPAGLWFVLGALSELGFDTEWLTLRASDVGAVQERQRTFIMGFSRCAKWGPYAEPGGLRSKGHAAGWDETASGVGDAGEVLGLSRRECNERRRIGGVVLGASSKEPYEACERQWNGHTHSNASSPVEFTSKRGLGAEPRCGEGPSGPSESLRDRARWEESNGRSSQVGSPVIPRRSPSRQRSNVDAGEESATRRGGMGNASGAGLQGRTSERSDSIEELAPFERAGLGLFPPGQGAWSDWYCAPDGRAIRFPLDRDAIEWCRISRISPWLMPAVEPGIRCASHGAPMVVDESRTDQLRQLGNGVVPIQGSAAFNELTRRLGVVIGASA